MPSFVLLLVPLIALVAMSIVFRDNFAGKVIGSYFGVYALVSLAIILFHLALPLIGVVGAILVLVMFFHAKLRRFM